MICQNKFLEFFEQRMDPFSLNREGLFRLSFEHITALYKINSYLPGAFGFQTPLLCSNRDESISTRTRAGVRLAQLLLANMHLWSSTNNQTSGRSNSPPQPPLFLVCCTNHALDQFLVDIISTVGEDSLQKRAALTYAFNSGVVRVGGRSKEERLKQYTMCAQRELMHEQRLVPRGLHKGKSVVNA